MSNAIFHNKWHGFNHYTVPLTGFPDSGTDPIASAEFPFRGIFYNVIKGDFGLSLDGVTIFDPGSGFTSTPSLSLRVQPEESMVDQPLFKVGVDIAAQTLSSIEVLDGGSFFTQGVLIFTPGSGETLKRLPEVTLTYRAVSASSDSLGWEFYSSLTQNNSSDWNKYFSVRDTTTPLSASWDLGFNSYLTLSAISGVYDSVYTHSVSLSPETRWDGEGGTGWHIALSSITHRTNEPYQIDTRQKVARPVGLTSNKALSTITWDLSAQTVYFAMTGTDSLTAKDIINPKKGGKYVMWIYVDRCPVERANVIFDPANYNISIKTLSGNYIQTNNVIALTANYITRIDFVYDGQKMLGKASRFRIYAPTDDDLYFQGSGLQFTDPNTGGNKSPVYINPNKNKIFGILSVNSDIDNISQGGVNIESYSNEYTETSSFYIPGSGIRFRFLNGDNQYFNYNLVNAEFQSKATLNRYQSLTGSFDKVVGTLSGRGDWRLPQFAENLIASPNESEVTDNIILSALPTVKYGGPWVFEDTSFRSVKTCLSTYTVEIYSGKNRDIESILVNDISVPINPIVPVTYYGSCHRQPYTFYNERTAYLTFERISSDYDIQITYRPQTPNLIPNLLAWMTAQDDLSLSLGPLSALTAWRSNTEYQFSIARTLPSIAPIVQTEFGVRRFINFSGTRSMQSAEGNAVRPLTALSASQSFLKGFTTFTVFKPLETTPLSSVIWWIGDLNENSTQGGFGLVLSGYQLYTIGNFIEKYQNRQLLLEFDSTRLFQNNIFIVTTKYDPDRNPYRQEIYVNNGRNNLVRSIYQTSFFDNTVTTPLTNFDLMIGKHPTKAEAFGRFHMYDFYIYDRALSRNEIISMNRFLNDKFSLFSDTCGLNPVNIDELPAGFIACNTPVNFSGRVGYPSPEFKYVLGTGAGWVELEYDSYWVPDRFIVTYNDNFVIDTGYVGGRSFDVGGSQRATFTSNLNGKTDPTTGLIYPNFSVFPEDGYPRVKSSPAGSPGGGRARFYKADILPIEAKVQSWAPIPGTAWRCILGCPVPSL